MIGEGRQTTIVLLGGFAAITAAVAAGWSAPLDQATAMAAATHRTPFQSAVAINLTALGSAPVVVILAVIAAAYAVASGRPRIVLALLWAPLAFLLDTTVKQLVHHPRPTVAMIAVPPDYSFPSGHAVAASALYVTLALVAAGAERRAGPRRLLIASGVAVALLVAWSRVYLGVHYLSDVVGGFVLGTAGAMVAARAVTANPVGQADRQGLSDSGA
jgi:undecaprenyl-diphosphatase